MYILSMNLINTKENVFFQDTTEETPKFLERIVERNKKSFFKVDIRFSRNIQQDTFILRTDVGVFKTIESARKFFVDFTDSDESIREESRAWNQQNNILTKVQIISIVENKIITELSNCLTSTCERFGGKCDETNGCSTVTFAKEYIKSKKPFPIKVVVG